MIEEQYLPGSGLEVDMVWCKTPEIHSGKQGREVMEDIDTGGPYILN